MRTCDHICDRIFCKNPHIAYFSAYNCVFDIAYAEIMPHMRKFAYFRVCYRIFSAFLHICPREVGSGNLDRVLVSSYMLSILTIANCSSLAKICNTSCNEAIISEFRDLFISVVRISYGGS